MTSTLLRVLALSPVLAGAAAAQSFNLDVGPNTILSPGPSPSYAAAAGQAGHWMEFKDPFSDVHALEDLNGAVSGVTLVSDGDGWVNIFPSVITPGDDQRLMEDTQWLPNLDVPVNWTFSGLANGDYQLYTYASDPSSGGIQSEITVVGSPDPAQVVGSAWPGNHVLGGTYALHRVTVTDGTLHVIAKGFGAQPNNSGLLNGFQLVAGGGGGSVGSNYCGPSNLNSSGKSAVISGFGSDVATKNDLTLTAGQLPVDQFGYFLNSDVQGFTPFPPGSQGNLCLSGGIGRHTKQIAKSDSAGEITVKIDLSALQRPNGTHTVLAGETWNFQCWFRDTPASSSNFTDGLEVLFL